MAEPVSTSEGRSGLGDPLRGAALLSLGTVASGVLAYAFNAVAARVLGPASYGPVAVLWAATFIVAVTVFRPFEQTLSRAIAVRRAHGHHAHEVARSVTRLVVVVALVLVLGATVAWGPISDGLFNGNEALTAALLLGIVGYGLSYLVRGVVGGVRWFQGYGALLLGDGAIRLLLLVPLIFYPEPWVAGLAVAGAAFGGALTPLLLRGWRSVRGALRGTDGPAFPIGEGVRFAAPATVISASDQILLNAGPLIIAIQGGPHAARNAGIVFAATMLVRAPAFLFQGLAAAALPSLTALQATDDDARFSRALFRAVAALVAFSIVVVLGVFVAGPQAMQLLFGDSYAVSRASLVILAVGAGIYLTAGMLSQALLARGRVMVGAASWAVSALTFVVLVPALPGDPVHRVCLAFALAGAVGLAGLTSAVLRGQPRRARLSAQPVSVAQQVLDPA